MGLLKLIHSARIWHYPEYSGGVLLSIAAHDASSVPKILQSEKIAVHLLEQLHSSKFVKFPFVKLTEGESERPTGDAWLWTEKLQNTALGVYTADCIPAFLLAETGAGALLHLGRKGIEGCLLAKTVEALRGVEVLRGNGQLFLILGPAIGPCCYEVPISMAEAFCAMSKTSSACIVRREQACFLDLRQAVIEQTKACAVLVRHVEPECTSCQAQKYIADPKTEAPCYSYRQGHKTERIYTFFLSNVK